MRFVPGVQDFPQGVWTVSVVPENEAESLLLHRLAYEAARRMPDQPNVIMPIDRPEVILDFAGPGGLRGRSDRFKEALAAAAVNL